MMRRARVAAILAGGLLAAATSIPGAVAAAPDAGDPSVLQDSIPALFVESGQPPRPDLRWGALLGFDTRENRGTARVFLGGPFARLPAMIDFGGETAAGVARGKFDASVGVRLGFPWITAGYDYDLPDHRFGFALSVQYPLRRGGLLHGGDLLRVQYLFDQDEVQVGASMPSPVRPYRVTRLIDKDFRTPRLRFRAVPDTSLPADVLERLALIDHCVDWMDRYTTPRLDPGDGFERRAAPLREHLRRPGHAPREETARYHRELDAVFTQLVGGDSTAGAALARRAEAIVFDRVLVPFDGGLGQEKDPPDAAGYCAGALAAFDAALADSVRLPATGDTLAGPARMRCRAAFARVLTAIRRASVQAKDRWRESFLLWNDRARLAWLPLGYGLRADQYETQAGWDSVLQQVTGGPYTAANRIQYLMMEQFHVELKRMLRETADYQVTIVHDFRGDRPEGGTDVYGWDMVVDGYVAAFVQAVRDLDAGRRTHLPQFYLFLDQHYYDQNHERGIITHLENLYAPPEVDLDNKDIAVQVRAAEDSLRSVVSRSRALAGIDEAELEHAIRVHVLITNPTDPAFTLDVLRRDHRKIAFRDVTEADPGSGVAIVTGQGVGEHYNGSGWEDRSIEVSGSALVEFKDIARELLRGQGLGPGDIPACLKVRAFPPDYEERCRQLHDRGWDTPVSVVSNETGYGHKGATVLKAAMYDLAADSSTVLGFDSLWLSGFWTGMFLGASLRGAHMFAVAPSAVNAPSSGAQVLYYTRENLDVMYRAQEYFAGEIAASGGLLRLGIYDHQVETHDFRRRLEAILEGRAKYPFLREWFPLDPVVDSLMARYARKFEQVPIVGLRLRAQPFLHMKFQLYASRRGMQILARKEWAPVLQEHLGIRVRQVGGQTNPGVTPDVLRVTDPGRPGSPTLRQAFEQDLRATDPAAPGRVVFTTTIGTHNQNPRSLFLDGETTVAVSGYDGLITAPDFVFILYIARWPSTRAEFDHVYPKQRLPWYLVPFKGFLKSQL